MHVTEIPQIASQAVIDHFAMELTRFANARFGEMSDAEKEEYWEKSCSALAEKHQVESYRELGMSQISSFILVNH
jgi:hypothetical protein